MIDVEKIDGLVDGTLGPEARAALIGELEASPGGWRRCALAFLEAQAWGEALSVPAAVPARARWPRRLAVAAGVMSAFGLGWSTRRPGVVEVPTVAASATVSPRADPPPVAAAPAALAVGRPAHTEYRVDRRGGLLAVGRAPDGRRVAVPVGAVRVRYMGTQSL